MDKQLFRMLTPPLRPEGFGITAKELAEQTGYTRDGARRVLDRNKDLAILVMRWEGARVNVYVQPDQIGENEWYRAWLKHKANT